MFGLNELRDPWEKKGLEKLKAKKHAIFAAVFDQRSCSCAIIEFNHFFLEKN